MLPDWLRYEINHRKESLREGIERLRIKEKVSDHPRIALVVAVLFILLLGKTVSHIVYREPSRQYRESRKAWFYDLNTGKLFVGSGKEYGPIKAPSGPLPNGDPAGVRAHVYSYRSDPNEAELFVGFLERPDPNSNVTELTSDPDNFEAWARGRLIRRPAGDQWISPTSQRGRQIIQQLKHPDMYGQMATQQVPD